MSSILFCLPFSPADYTNPSCYQSVVQWVIIHGKINGLSLISCLNPLNSHRLLVKFDSPNPIKGSESKKKKDAFIRECHYNKF